MDVPLLVVPRPADRDDRLVEMFAALALIAPDQESVGLVMDLALGGDRSLVVAPTMDAPWRCQASSLVLMAPLATSARV